MKALSRRQRNVWIGAVGLSVVAVMLWYVFEHPDRDAELHSGTWIWDARTIITDREDILDFSERQGVNHLYVYVDRSEAAPKDYALFIKEASKRRMKVEALAGDPTWGWKRNREHLQEFIEWVASYNTNVQQEERFSGIHLDIEPYLLPEWGTDPYLVEEWLSNMEFAAAFAGKYGELNVSVDVPFWIHEIDVPGYEDFHAGAWMLKRFDTVVLMDYRDTAAGDDGIVANALEMVKAASAMNQSIIVAVETAPSGEDPKTTFFEEGNRKMEQELASARSRLRSFQGFRGTAVHGFPYWMKGGAGKEL